MAEIPDRTIKDIQQDFADNSGFRQETIWDLLRQDQGDLLKEKLTQLIPLQENRQAAIEEQRESMFQSIWAQRKFTNGNSVTAIIYVFVAKNSNVNNAEQSREFSCHPIVRARKCFQNDDGNTENCCMLFIDEIGRVYQRWESFLNENQLPEGIMVAPKKGIYTLDNELAVELEKCPTPASGVVSQALETVDRSAAFGGIVATCIPVLAIVGFPVAAPLLAFSSVVGACAAGYSTLRAAANLYDRGSHEQSVDLTDRQARNSWLGVGAGVVGLGAATATGALSTAAASGRSVTLATELAVNGLNISSIVLSGAGVANGALDLILRYQNEEEIDSLDVLQLSASLFLFTHSVQNFRLASSIVSDARSSAISAYRKSLSNRQRRSFDRMFKETIRIKGEIHGKVDIIRSVNEIPSKQYLNDLYRINRNLNEKMIRPSFGGEGRPIVLNMETPVNTQELRASVQHNIGPDIVGHVRQPIPQSSQTQQQSSQSVNRIFRATTNIEPVISSVEFTTHFSLRAYSHKSIFLSSGASVELINFGERFLERIINFESFETVLETMASIFDEQVLRFLIRLARRFVERRLQRIEQILRLFITSESVLYQILLEIKRIQMPIILRRITLMEENILDRIHNYYVSLAPTNIENARTRCTYCRFYFTEGL